MPDFNLLAKEHEQYYELRIVGKFNIVSAAKIRRLAEIALSSGFTILLIDLSRTSEIDNTGIKLLQTLQKQYTSKNGKIHLLSPSAKIVKVLNERGMQKIVSIHQNIQNFNHAITSGELIKEERGFYTLFKIPKEFDLHVVKPLRNIIEESLAEGHSHIVFDLNKTNYITSVGIGVLINLHKNLQKKGGSVHLVSIPDKILTLLEDTNILKVLPEYSTVSEVDEKFI